MPTLTSLAPGFAAGLLALVAAGAQYAKDETSTSRLSMASATRAVAPTDPANDGVQALLDQHAELWAEPLEGRSPRLARQLPTLADAAIALVAQDGRSTEPTSLFPGIGSSDLKLRGAPGGLEARVYTPSGPGPFPAIVYFHGGTFVTGSPATHDLTARGLADRTQAVVVSVAYRLAPERKFPAAHDDALAAWRWTYANASSLNVDSTRMALAGEGAGGTLALATAIAARDRNLAAPSHVLAVYPIAGTDTMSASYRESHGGLTLTKATMAWSWEHALPKHVDRRDPRIDLLSADLRGLPPVTLVAAELDPLRSEGALLAERLRAAGIDVERQEWAGVPHDFFGLTPVLPAAREAQRLAGLRLRRSLAVGR